MKKLKIQVQFPYNWYAIRTLGVYDENGKKIQLLYVGGVNEIEVPDNSSRLTVKLDFYKAHLNLGSESVQNFKLGARGKNSMEQILYSLSPKFLEVQEVKEEELHLSSEEKTSPSRKVKVDNFSVACMLIIAAVFVYASIFLIHSTTERNFTMLFGATTLVTLFPFLFRKETGENFYFNRLFLSAVVGIMFVLILDLDILMKLWLIPVLVLMALKTWIRHKLPNRNFTLFT